jgi:plastocyanin
MRKLLLTAVLAAVVLAACGGGGATEFTVNAKDTLFEPDSWSVVAGETLTMTFVNEGFLEHEFLIVRQGEEIDAMSEWDDAKQLYSTGAVSGQTQGQYQLQIDEPGTYQVICTIDNHFDGGMAGTLEVTG